MVARLGQGVKALFGFRTKGLGGKWPETPPPLLAGRLWSDEVHPKGVENKRLSINLFFSMLSGVWGFFYFLFIYIFYIYKSLPSLSNSQHRGLPGGMKRRNRSNSFPLSGLGGYWYPVWRVQTCKICQPASNRCALV